MRFFQPIAYLCLALVLVTASALVGCQRVDRSSVSTTTETGGEYAGTTESPGPVAAAPTSATVGGDVSAAFQPAAVAGKTGEQVPIEIELPAPAFRGTPKPAKEPNVEKPLNKPRAPFYAPRGTVNLARAKPVSCSDPAPASGELDLVTDGDKEATDFGYLELHPGTAWVQIDLGKKATVYAVLIWHNHAEARVYRDVIVQVSDDPDFLEAVTVFNNDYDNSSGMGIGERMGYVETSEGKLVDCQGVEGRYVRFYSRGNHIDDTDATTGEKNHYTEVEVYGTPAA